jgi:AraC-like DNA-binding protein
LFDFDYATRRNTGADRIHNRIGCADHDRASAMLDIASEIHTCVDRTSSHAQASWDTRMTADALSDVLKTVRLTGAAFFDVVAKAPWVAESLPRAMLLPKILPGAEHLIAYHVLTEGRCVANIIGEEPVTVEAGEVIVFTRGDPHVLSSSPGMRADSVPADKFAAAIAGQLPFSINYGGDGAVSAKVVCGFLACDARPFNPLLDNLPPVIKVRDREGDDASWLGQFIRLATMESAEKRVGGEGVLAKLSELMFIEVIRRYLADLPPEQAGWLAGLRDPFVGKALSLMHASPQRGWTIEILAKDVGLSRSVLAERFADLVGMPPMHYLANWRMQLAAGLLSGGKVNIATVAAETGYASEAAFSRAFKKIVGVPPSDWRRRTENDGSDSEGVSG